MSDIRSLGEIAVVVRGISFPKEAKSLEPRPGDVACLRMANVQQQVDWEDLWYVPAKHVRRHEQYVEPGDILISTANSYELVGKVALVSSIPRQATLGAFIALIRSHEDVEPKFLYHQLAWGKTQSRIRETASTTTNISNVSTKKLAALDLQIPALDVQRRIVAELEKEFSLLDGAVANLKRVEANLKRYRVRVMDSAFTGEMRSANISVPAKWSRARLGLLGVTGTATVQTGPFGAQLHNTEFTTEGVPVIAVGNLTGTGFTTEGLYFVTPEKAATLSRYDVQSGDLLFARSGATLGKVCLAPDYVKNWRMTGHILRARFDISRVNPKFVLYALAGCAAVRRQVFGSIRGVTRPGFNTSLLESIELPLPPRREQDVIVDEVDRCLSVVEGIEAAVKAGFRRGARLRDAVLGACFAKT